MAKKQNTSSMKTIGFILIMVGFVGYGITLLLPLGGLNLIGTALFAGVCFGGFIVYALPYMESFVERHHSQPDCE